MDNYRQQIKNEVQLLSDVKKIAFAALTSEKLYPNYVFFQKNTGWGNAGILESALVVIYQSMLNRNKIDKEIIKDSIFAVDSITPDTEDFPGLLTSFALDSCTSIYNTLNYLLDNNIEHIIDVAIYARDTVDMFVQEKEDLEYSDPYFELKIVNDQFMVRETNRQMMLLKRLRNIQDNELFNLIDNLRDRTAIIDINLLP
ncbi:DUF416 family protein [Mucilaginibacter corticis]|uniref:DUF416 family protein n=1 Tax=Mucilaginibacter corticis TaxID=2597670 RepID=A0A556ML83_9SPHI|nr:DUF416 family protein [Mucilaginibacter corticis]TSJ40643.1 DUF416 family protein [Mucilaginibacter corticis]